MSTDGLNVCDPCKDTHHLECEGTKERPCDCLICEGERIGDQVLGELGGNMPKHR